MDSLKLKMVQCLIENKNPDGDGFPMYFPLQNYLLERKLILLSIS
jgi:hypothetical protein